MEERPPRLGWVWFSFIRLGLFAVVLAVLLLVLPVQPWVSAVLAAIIALCLSLIFLWTPLGRLVGPKSAPRVPDNRDDDIEDAAVDATGELRS
ncbi:MAG: hypothetical protein JWP66_669 [Naasia sp.]|nr:hypothetical protein [Naasia sp.]